MKTKTVMEMDYTELEELVQKHYGQKFSFVADQESGNDSAHSFVFKKEEMHDYDKHQLQEFKTGIHQNFITCVIMQDMVNNGILAEGEYLIQVCW